MVSLVVSLRQLLPRAQSSMNVTMLVYGNFRDPVLKNNRSLRSVMYDYVDWPRCVSRTHVRWALNDNCKNLVR